MYRNEEYFIICEWIFDISKNTKRNKLRLNGNQEKEFDCDEEEGKELLLGKQSSMNSTIRCAGSSAKYDNYRRQ